LAIAGQIAKTLNLPGAALLGWLLCSSVALVLIALPVAYVAHKLGLIDLACFRKKGFEREADGESVVYVHQKPEVPIAESLAPAEATVETHKSSLDESSIKDPLNEPAKTPEWQEVEIKSPRKIRYYFSTRSGRDDSGK
jgi:hypothetical protein